MSERTPTEYNAVHEILRRTKVYGDRTEYLLACADKQREVEKPSVEGCTRDDICCLLWDTFKSFPTPHEIGKGCALLLGAISSGRPVKDQLEMVDIVWNGRMEAPLWVMEVIHRMHDGLGTSNE